MATKKPRADKRKNVWKVAKVLAVKPNATVREIARETNMWTSTAHRAKEELEKTGTKDPTINYIVGASKARLEKIQWVMDRFIDETVSKKKLTRLDTSLIKEIAKDDLQRITVLWWTVTDDDGGLKQIVSYIIPDNGR